jgi:hypothetical protein
MNPDRITDADRLAVRQMQIIVSALILGVVTFAIIAFLTGGLLQSPQPATQPGPGSILLTLRMACGLLIVVGACAPFAVRAVQVRMLAQAVNGDASEGAVDRGQTEANAAETMQMFGSGLIICAALAEGPALFGGVILMLSGEPLDLLLIAVPLTILILQLPTAGRIAALRERAWLRRERNERGWPR